MFKKVLGWTCIVLLLFGISVSAQDLEGRRIVIDAGHGGEETGAIGPTGLEEKDINLAVALHLRDLLVAENATVYMTREDDSTHSLQDRVDFTHKYMPDLFISVHHNSMDNAPHESFIEVYHSVRDRGAGQVFGRILLDELVETTGLGGKTMGPGNYYLLNRIVELPAVIGEAYYISHPPSEEALRQPETLKAEAEAYLRAVKRFFALGLPVIEVTNLQDGDKVQELYLEAILDPDKGNVDLDSISVTLNGETIEHKFDQVSNKLTASSQKALPSGEYSFRVRMANDLGGVASYVERTVTLANHAAAIAWTVEPGLVPADPKAEVQVTVDIQDQFGFPILTGTGVDVSVTGGALQTQNVVIEDGKARFVISPAAGAAEASVTVQVDELTSTRTIPFNLQQGALVSGQITSQGEAVTNALVNGHAVNEQGYYFLVLPQGQHEIGIEAPGYYSQVKEVEVQDGKWFTENGELETVAQGVFHGKTIVLDGKTEYDFTTLIAYLALAGAEVEQVFGEEAARIDTIRGLSPDFVLSFGEGDSFFGHFPRSASAKSVAEIFADRWLESLGQEILVDDTRERVILRAPGDALLVQMPNESYFTSDDAAFDLFIALWKALGGEGQAPSLHQLN